MSTDRIVKRPTVTVTVEAVPHEAVTPGQWYWVKDDDGEEWLGCATHIGSNYVKMIGVSGSSERVHLDVFQEKCRPEQNATRVISGNVQQQKERVNGLLGEVAALTARLGVGHTALLGEGSEGAALAKLDPKQDVSAYKTALVKAKEESLPELFHKIEQANETLAMWLKAETLPMRAQLGQMKGAIERIDDRIFNVELYAGLTEQVVRIIDGEPANMTEKVRLMQRRCYMDEECLAQYETGGMEFSDIADFDAWLAKPANMNRLLPFPRCIVSFRVRRYDKERPVPSSFIQFFYQIEEIRADKLTFLYIRNGNQLYRMNTSLEFGEELFPDNDHNKLTTGTKLWGKVSYGSVEKIITDAQYKGLLEEYRIEKAEQRAKISEHKAKVKAWREAKKAAKSKGEPFKEHEPWLPHFWAEDPAEQYQPYEMDNIYYDDIQKKIAAEIQQSNRIAIIIQGLLDRSMILHPHPPWKIWSPGGFEQALELVFDASRALMGGDKPDFEAYRQRLNETLKVGSITVGQQIAWSSKDESEDRERKKRRWYNDPGPGSVAKMVEYQRQKRRCGYAWYRDAESHSNYGKKIRARFVCDVSQVLNVEAYTPGDFRMFFNDPRTRAEYIKWAPLLLEAEEYHAGNRTVEEPPPPTTRVGSWDGRLAYLRRLKRQRFMGKTVKIVRDITTNSGKEYKKGSLWRVYGSERGRMCISEITKTGEDKKNGGYIRGVDCDDLEIVDLGISENS